MRHPFRQLVKFSPLYPLFALDHFLGHRVRHRLLKVLDVGLALFILLLLTGGAISYWPRLAVISPFIQFVTARFVGIIFILISFWFMVYLLEAYFRHRYFASVDPDPQAGSLAISFDVGRFLYKAHHRDLVTAFLRSGLGREWLTRLGIGVGPSEEFLKQRSTLKPAGHVALPPVRFDLPELVHKLLANYPDFAQWLTNFEIRQMEAAGAAAWIERTHKSERTRERWWTRARLGRIPGIAKGWAYGSTYTLDKYAVDLVTASETAPGNLRVVWYRQEVEEMENILSRHKEANALLIGPSGAPIRAVYEFTRLIRLGKIFPQLEHRLPKLLQVALLESQFKDRQGLEAELVKIFNEVTRAGDIILVIDDFPALVSNATALKANLPQLLDPYLRSGRVEVLALAESTAYHELVEAEPVWRERFEAIELSEPPQAVIETELLTLVETVESRSRGRIKFTYPAVLAVANLSQRFAMGETVVGESHDLLEEVSLKIMQSGQSVVTKQAVLALASAKFGVPLGSADVSERDKLLGLERQLHERVIGQDQAIVAIAKALRRNRAGIRDLKRPLGSFLFLGPTGVGKTETAKALAEVFFNGESNLHRFDMSEYRGPDALRRLIGSTDGGEPGTLVKLLRTSSYGVVLLDEFEKTEPKVLDLFLQVLDEGFFSDARGRRVNARESLFIATSNAGAPLIWDLIARGRHLMEVEPMIIDSLIKEGIFKPELLNRFDAVIIFNPLAEDESQKVAQLLLERLVNRLSGQGISLKLTEATARQVARYGADKKFGARPMSRYIRDNLEQLVADELLAGELRSGSEIEFVPPVGSENANWTITIKH